MAAAVVTGRAGLLLLAAPALAVLAISRRRPGLAAVEITAVPSASRCFEDEDIELTVTVAAPQDLDEIMVEFEPADTVSLVSGAAARPWCAAITRRRTGCCGPRSGAAARRGGSASAAGPGVSGRPTCT